MHGNVGTAKTAPDACRGGNPPELDPGNATINNESTVPNGRLLRLPGQRERLSLFGRIARKLKKLYRHTARQAKHWLARGVYSLPFLSRHDPRTKVIKFRDHCRIIDRFPQGTESLPYDWYLRIRPGEAIQRRTPLALHKSDLERFQKYVATYNQGEVFQLPEVFLACINKARIYGGDFLVMSDDRHIFWESALAEKDILEANGIFNTIIWPSSKGVSGEYCLLACPWSANNYSEWLLGNLPRLSVIEQFDELRSVPLIVPGPLRSYNKESLLMAGIPPERLVCFDKNYWQVDRLYFPQLPSPLGNPSPHGVAWLRSKFLDQIPLSPTPAKGLLYVTRRDAHGRRVLNEGEIVRYLKGIGFEIICPGDFSFVEQIKLFRDARIVVGPHGAAFANMVFAPANATLIEFFGDNYLHGCYWALASIRGQKHAFLTGPSQWMDYSISLDDLKILLRKVAAF